MQNIIKAFEVSDDSYKVIAVSTAHITEEDDKLLSNLSRVHCGPLVISKPHGHVIKLCPYTLEEMSLVSSDALNNILKAAFQAGCLMLELDSAATVYPELPTFDW